MKIKNIILGTMFAGLAASAIADTDITITGATAFRGAALQAIYNAYASAGSVGSGGTFDVCHSSSGNTTTALIGSTSAVFKGTFPGISGITTIRTKFTGSVEGLKSIAGEANETFLQASACTTGSGIVGGVTSPTEPIRPKFSFSDVYQSSTPVDSVALNPVGNSPVGAVAFCMVASKNAPANLTNVTNQHARSLWTNGIQKLSLFTGNASDTTLVFATGRNDGSGTRSTYLAEWNLGVASLIQQYVATKTGTANLATSNATVSAITLVPGNGTGSGAFETAGSTLASTIWGNSVPGNGGYNSGGDVAKLLGCTSSNVTVYNGVDQTPDMTGANVLLMSWLGAGDARTASTTYGAKILSYNGVKITPIVASGSFNNSGLSEDDFNKIVTGAYSGWGYEHLYYHSSLSSAEQTFYDALKNTYIEPALQSTSNGVRLSDLTVSRPDDGFPLVSQF